jgi:hypothetical protein
MSESPEASTSRYRRQDSDLIAATSALVAEYQVLRGEIGRYQDHQKQIINFAFVVVGGMLAFAGTMRGGGAFDLNPKGSIVLLYMPPIFALLAGLYSDRTVRILRLADYINNHLRRKMSSVLDLMVWQWEVYKRAASPISPRLAYGLDKVRWLTFVFPMFAAVALYFAVTSGPITLAAYFGMGTSLLFLVATMVIMFVAEETYGVANREAANLDEIDMEIVRPPLLSTIKQQQPHYRQER